MTLSRRRLFGPLPGVLALLFVPLCACAQSPANAAAPTPSAPPATIDDTPQPVVVLPVPQPQIVVAQIDPEPAAPVTKSPTQSATPGPAPAAATQVIDNDDEHDDVIAAARKTLQGYLDATTSLRANFRSVLLDERRIPVAESSGVVMVKRPHRFRWEYQEPNPSLILADGERLWSYDAELEQAVVRNLADMEGANPSNLLGGDTRVDEDFDVLGSYRSDTIEWVELRPRGQSDFTRVRLGFAGGKIELMELHDQLGQVTQIALTELEANADLDDSLFRFEPPPGTDIVGAD